MRRDEGPAKNRTGESSEVPTNPTSSGRAERLEDARTAVVEGVRETDTRGGPDGGGTDPKFPPRASPTTGRF